MDMRHFVTAINAAYFELFFPNFGNSSNKPKIVPSGQSSLTMGLYLPSGEKGLMAATLVNPSDERNEHRVIEVHGSGTHCGRDCAMWRIHQFGRHSFELESATPSGKFANVASWNTEHELNTVTSILLNMMESGGAYDSTSIMENLRGPVDSRFDNGNHARLKQQVQDTLGSKHHFGSPALVEHIELLREEFAGL